MGSEYREFHLQLSNLMQTKISLGKIWFYQVLRWHQKISNALFLTEIFAIYSTWLKLYWRFVSFQLNSWRLSNLSAAYYPRWRSLSERWVGRIEAIQLESFSYTSLSLFLRHPPDSIPWEGAMDSDHPLHFPGVLPDPPLRYHVLRLSWSLLLDSCHSRL